MQWASFHASPDQVVSVQTGYHPGWHATVNGRAAAVSRDRLGFRLIQPQCDGPCEIVMTYDGGWEYKLCRLLSALAILGLVMYAGKSIFQSRNGSGIES